MRARRRALSAPAQQLAARRLAHRLTRFRLFAAARRIAFYYPNDGEIDPRAAIHTAWRLGKQCYLPVLGRGTSRRLGFAGFAADTKLVRNRFGIPEPRTPRLPAGELDLVLVPLVAFDTAGNRIGMGGGFYDATMQYLAAREHWRRPRLLGLAHDIQKVAAIEVDGWDICLDGIITDLGYYDAMIG